jgi:hypothetical protein
LIHITKNVFAGLSLEDDVIDAVFVEELAEQKSRRAGSNNGDLLHRFRATTWEVVGQPWSCVLGRPM